MVLLKLCIKKRDRLSVKLNNNKFTSIYNHIKLMEFGY